MPDTPIFDNAEYGLTVAELRGLANALQNVNRMKPAGEVTAAVDIAGQTWRVRCGYDATGEFGMISAVIEET